MFNLHDRVILRPEYAGKYGAKVWTVVHVPTRANEVNYKLAPEGDPSGRGLRAPGDALTAAPEGDASPHVTVVPIPASHHPGTVVRYRGDVYVVTAESHGKHRLFPLGGSDRYYRSVPAASFTVIPRERITVEFASPTEPRSGDH